MNKINIILIIVLTVFLNSCFCYERYLNDLFYQDFIEFDNTDWQAFQMNVKYRDKDRIEVIRHTKTWLESNFYHRIKYQDAKDVNLIKSEKIFELYDEENGEIIIKGVRKENLDRIFECRIIVYVTQDEVKLIFHDFLLFEKYTREPYQLNNECKFFKIENDLRKLTNKFLYTKFD